MPGAEYRVIVAKEYLKFAAAHFIAHPGFRERLHGHNYQVSVRVDGRLEDDGYVLDFGVVKAAAKAVCGELDDRVLLPERSDCLTIERSGASVRVRCEDGSEFAFPATDVVLLPIAHTSAEELARHVLGRIRERLPELGRRGVTSIEVGVAEAPGQTAYCREEIGGP
jgi:6-pyruvoyltetrahydropterin/6-carboxytetrahydropterin synthase